MKTWKNTDKSEWSRGEWDSEPDKAHWIDESTNLDCLIVRNGGGALCGYVGVPVEHKFFEKHYDDDALFQEGVEIDVHGGLTFSNSCSDNSDESKGICHPESCAANKVVWWFGFDCAHCDDFSPSYDRPEMFDHGRTYKSFDYVKGQVENLAGQLYN